MTRILQCGALHFLPPALCLLSQVGHIFNHATSMMPCSDDAPISFSSRRGRVDAKFTKKNITKMRNIGGNK
jgi:hypothetical protein